MPYFHNKILLCLYIVLFFFFFVVWNKKKKKEFQDERKEELYFMKFFNGTCVTWNVFQENISSMPEASGSEVADESDYSIFENKTGLAEDMKFLASMPELCDVTFLVGETKEPICAVKAVLAARSRFVSRLMLRSISFFRAKVILMCK